MDGIQSAAKFTDTRRNFVPEAGSPTSEAVFGPSGDKLAFKPDDERDHGHHHHQAD